MKKSILLLSAVLLLFCFLTACNPPATPVDTNTEPTAYDPTPHITLGNPADGESQGIILGTLTNGSDVDLSVGGIFTVVQGNTTVGTGQMENITVARHEFKALRFDISHLSLPDGEYEFVTAYTWKNESGTLSSKDVSMTYVLSRSSVEGPPPANRDVKTTPIAEMTESEGEELAQYLFERYVPNCFSIFESTSDLSSATLWPSIYALNGAVDEDVSDQTLTREDALKKVARYYPGATFVPEDIRMFNKTTQTFLPAPGQAQEYKFLSWEIKEDCITVYYEDIPEDKDQLPGQYATTLKNSEESGYFSFVSTLRVGIVG